MVNWLIANYIELTAAVLGLVGIALQIKQNHWYWLTSIVMVLLYIYVFFETKFYADMGFQVYYLVVSIYGWWYWVTHKSKILSKQLIVNTLTRKAVLICTFVTIILFIGIYFVLQKFTDSPIPFGDAFTTALSITATWLLARKYIENWLLWIVVDGVSACLYIYKGLYPTFILFVVLTMLAAVGYIHWRRARVKQNILMEVQNTLLAFSKNVNMQKEFDLSKIMMTHGETIEEYLNTRPFPEQLYEREAAYECLKQGYNMNKMEVQEMTRKIQCEREKKKLL